MPGKRTMRGGNVGASSDAALIQVAGTENRATGEIDLHVDSKKGTARSKLSGGGHRRSRRRVKSRRKSSSKSKRRGRGGSMLGAAILPFGLLWGQKSYQNSSSKSKKRRPKSRRRTRSRR
jgi:hypothetical protein